MAKVTKWSFFSACSNAAPFFHKFLMEKEYRKRNTRKLSIDGREIFVYNGCMSILSVKVFEVAGMIRFGAPYAHYVVDSVERSGTQQQQTP